MVPISSPERIIPSVHKRPIARSKSLPGVLIVTVMLSPFTRISSGSSTTTSSSICFGCSSSSFNTRNRFRSCIDPHYRRSNMSKAASDGLKVGQKAPDFTVTNDTGQKVKLSDFKGKKLVLYFYPKDDTPGCTAEACAFRDGIEEIKCRVEVVVGVSTNSVESHT